MDPESQDHLQDIMGRGHYDVRDICRLLDISNLWSRSQYQL